MCVVCLFCFVIIKTNNIYLKGRKRENRQTKDNTLRNRVKCNVLMSCVNFYCTHIYKLTNAGKYCVHTGKKNTVLTEMIEPVFTVHISPVHLPPMVTVAFTWLHSHMSDVSLDALRLVADILQEIKSTFWSERPEMPERARQERTAMCT